MEIIGYSEFVTLFLKILIIITSPIIIGIKPVLSLYTELKLVFLVIIIL